VRQWKQKWPTQPTVVTVALKVSCVYQLELLFPDVTLCITRVKLRQASLPLEMKDIERRIKFIVARMESAISSKDFEKAEHYKNQEQLERESLRSVRDKYNITETASMGLVTKADIEDVVSRWTGVPVNAIKEEELERLTRIEEELHKRIVSQEPAISALARSNTASNIDAVSRPVFVLSREQW